jgi:hypothetical protein
LRAIGHSTMRLKTRLVTVLTLAWLGTGCTRDTENYCCTDPQICPQVVACTSAERPFCDMAGEVGGTPRLCQADPLAPDAAPSCSASLPCESPIAPACVEGTCSSCTGEADCGRFASTPHCGDQGACVGCRDDGDCTAAAPVCDDDTDACRGCRAHAECPLGVCDLAGGMCVEAKDIVFVDGAAVGGGDCSQAMACKTVNEALAKLTPTRRFMKLAAGTYVEDVTIDGKSLVLVGKGATLQPVTNGASALQVKGTSTVAIDGLRLSGAGNGGDGLRCVGNPPAVTAVAMTDVTIEQNAAQGVDAFDCVVELRRSRVLANTGGGLSLKETTFTIVNNFIAQNGSASSNLGGVKLDGGSGQFDFNTVALNVAPANVVGGVICGFAANQAFGHDIVFGNQPAASPQVGGSNCSWSYSNIGQLPVPMGEGNMNDDPLFVDGTANDFHLQATSPCRDKGVMQPAVAEDIDGQVRPSGTAADIGADEIAP